MDGQAREAVAVQAGRAQPAATVQAVAATILLYDYPTSICSQMARLALVEKGVPFQRRTVDIMARAEQFETWYMALNPKAVVPTLAIDDEIVTDTIRIVHRIDRDFDGPRLTPADPGAAAAMEAIMRDVMGLHYGVLMYSRRLDAAGKSPIVVGRGRFLREQRAKYPERAGILDSRIEGNERLQAALADPAEVARHIEEARALVSRIDRALADAPFVGGDRYTLADTFATPALARFRVHGFDAWWSNGGSPNVAGYYRRMRERQSWSTAAVVDQGNESDL
jgi:glutathione S-transferase